MKNMKPKLKNIIAISVGILPIKIIMIWYRLNQTDAFTTSDMLFYPLTIGVGNILLILGLNKYFLKKTIKDFNFGDGKWFKDIFYGLLLTIIIFLNLFIFKSILQQGQPASKEIINMLIDLVNNPILLAIWLGPVVWIGVALFEELSRTFFLNCLWRLSSDKHWELFSILLVSVFAGLIHLYQGIFGIICIGIQGLIMGLFYYKFRRIWPLIISHALYDSVQIVDIVVQLSR